MGRRFALAFGAAGLVCAGVGVQGRARADDGNAAPPSDLTSNLYEVGALTAGWTSFLRDHGPLAFPVGSAYNPPDPLFAPEAEELERPLGSKDLIEVLQRRLGRQPFEAEGVSIAEGFPRLYLRASPAFAASVAKALADLESEILPLYAVDLVALTGDPASADGPQGLARAMSSGALTAIAFARASGHSGHRCCSLAGGQSSYLQGLDPSVGPSSSVVDPLVATQPEGLDFSVQPEPSGSDVVLDLAAWLARPGPLRAVRGEAGDTVETPSPVSVDLQAKVRVKSGEWTLVQTSGDVTFAVRATVRAVASVPPPARPLPALAPVGPDGPGGLDGPLVRARILVHDLDAAAPFLETRPIFLEPSRYDPRESESFEPPRLFPADVLAELIKSDVDPKGWSREGTAAEGRNGVLSVVHDERHVAAVRSLVDGLRARVVRPFTCRATIVSLPAAAFREAMPRVGSDLLADGGKGLLSAAGASVLARASVRTFPVGRVASTFGRQVRYVGDYDAMIAEKAAIGNPVVREFLEGVVLDVRTSLTLAENALACEVRLDRSRLREIRSVPTRHGALELPSIALERYRGRTIVPLGGTVLLSAHLWQDEATLVLFTVTEG